MNKYLKGTLLTFVLLSSIAIVSCSGGETSVRPVNNMEADVYFIAGQSNAAGCSDFYRGDLKTLNLSEPYANKAEMYKKGFNNVLYFGAAYDTNKSINNIYRELAPVKACMGVIKSREFGAELGMAEYLNDKYDGENKKAIIIKYAVNASGLLSNTSAWGEWSAPSYKNYNLKNEPNLYDNMIGLESNSYKGGMLYDAFTEMYMNGFSKVNFKGFYWSQGESDEGNIYYGRALGALIGDFRSDIEKVGNAFKEEIEDMEITSSANMPFLISEIAPTQADAKKNADGTSSRETLNLTIRLQREVAETYDNVYTLNTAEFDIVNEAGLWNSSLNPGVSYCGDQWHYNGDDMLEIGNRVGNLLYNV